mmetsp:Transcript_86031/g.171814  ORF Transcript_86031/g.171814 Transcript_86031/m.171814 type:complete len:141 (+) Transcript_86031:1026-1448(+)
MAEADAADTASRLRSITEAELSTMRDEGRRVFHRYFRSVDVQLSAVMEILRGRDEGRDAECYQTPNGIDPVATVAKNADTAVTEIEASAANARLACERLVAVAGRGMAVRCCTSLRTGTAAGDFRVSARTRAFSQSQLSQ